ncbi:receptor-like protein 7 [Castanea sativa]|uniref:receptor-like protein 7 n=1 Tax=Castanea sativa TaxID=21020 RepID=UPI003F65296C
MTTFVHKVIHNKVWIDVPCFLGLDWLGNLSLAETPIPKIRAPVVSLQLPGLPSEAAIWNKQQLGWFLKPRLQPLCHGDESSALLQFKKSFIINNVDCDEDTGHVTGLDLSSSRLYGSINSNSTLFRLVHLQRLNLADNHFNYSQIPSQVGNLSRLTYLNLSHSEFFGQFPFDVSKLSQLSALDLCCNYDLSSGKYFLQFKQLSLTSLVGNLTRIENLDPSGVNIFSTVPNIFANLSNLRSLYLRDCGMHGKFPIGIFKLPNLRVLDVKYNQDLTGSWPDFQYLSSLLEEIDLASTVSQVSYPFLWETSAP